MDFKTDFKPLTVDPDKIYDYSFSIIAEEMGEHNFTEDEWKVVRRIIHASADFELGRSVIITPGAIEAGIKSILAGRHVIADVQMIESGSGKNASKSMVAIYTVISLMKTYRLRRKTQHNTCNYFYAKGS